MPVTKAVVERVTWFVIAVCFVILVAWELDISETIARATGGRPWVAVLLAGVLYVAVGRAWRSKQDSALGPVLAAATGATLGLFLVGLDLLIRGALHGRTGPLPELLLYAVIWTLVIVLLVRYRPIKLRESRQKTGGEAEGTDKAT